MLYFEQAKTKWKPVRLVYTSSNSNAYRIQMHTTPLDDSPIAMDGANSTPFKSVKSWFQYPAAMSSTLNGPTWSYAHGPFSSFRSLLEIILKTKFGSLRLSRDGKVPQLSIAHSRNLRRIVKSEESVDCFMPLMHHEGFIAQA